MTASVVSHVSDKNLIANIVDSLYDKMLDDYRINRFFFTRPVAEQSAALKTFINAVINPSNNSKAEQLALLDEYFYVAFGRTNAKPSLVSNRDFAFLLDIVGGQDIRPMNIISPAHSFLMKLLPDDEHYDIVMAHLTDTLHELNVTGEQAKNIIAFAESGRDGLLGRSAEISQAA